jgi:hypothetical protein
MFYKVYALCRNTPKKQLQQYKILFFFGASSSIDSKKEKKTDARTTHRKGDNMHS